MQPCGTFLLVLGMTFLQFPAVVFSSEIDASCLSIICKVSSNCDADQRCLGSGSAHCGPFQISPSYWKDSGSPGDSFQSCAFNLSCSTSAVASYMTRYAKDCNKDDIIDCADYAAIHKAGADHCADHWVPKSAFMQSFFSLSGRSAEASETDETRVAFRDHFHSDLRDFRRVRPPPTPGPPSRRRVRSPPGYPLPDILTALRPWIVDTADSSRGRRRPGSEVPRRRRVRPQPRPNDSPRTTARPPITTTSRSTQPPVVPTRRRLRPVITVIPVTSPPSSHRPFPPTAISATMAPVTIPWWRLATTPYYTVSSSPVTIAPTTRRSTAAVTVEPAIVTSTTRSPITRRVTVRPTTATVSTSTSPPPQSSTTKTTTTTETTTTTRKPTTKPTFNPIRTNSTTPSVNDVEVNQDVPFKSNATVKKVPLSAACMECICIASSGCNFDANLKCYGEEECGPYRIDYAYWYEAGYPGYKGDEDDFANCARNQTCAEEAVASYVTSKSRDCNEDGVMDCLDYASTHKAGPEACNTAYMFDSKFWAAFTSCYGFEEREMNQRRR